MSHIISENPTATPVRLCPGSVRAKLNRWLFDLHHPTGRNVNLCVIFVVVAGVIISMLTTIPEVRAEWGRIIWWTEIGITIGFGVEYLLRLYAAQRRREYAFGFFGLVDLFTVLPLLFTGDPALALRLLRILRLLKLARYLGTLWLFLASLRDVVEIIVVAVSAIGLVVLMAGNVIYILEPQTVGNAFGGVWWSLVTMTTVGYGDIVPQTIPGQLLAALLMIMGIGLFAMITAIVSFKLVSTMKSPERCVRCDRRIESAYSFCPYCGVPQRTPSGDGE